MAKKYSRRLPPPSRPEGLRQPTLRRVAGDAWCIAQVQGALNYLDDMYGFELDLYAEDERAGLELAEDHPLCTAIEVISNQFEVLDSHLEVELRELFDADRALWGRLQLDVIQPWQKAPGQ